MHQPLPPSRLSFTFLLDPRLIQVLSHTSPHRCRAFCLPRHPHPSVPVSSTLKLFFLQFTCFTLLARLLLPPLLPHPASVPLFAPQGRSLMNTESPEQISLLIHQMYPSIHPSDRQQKTKCLLSETFPISFSSPSTPLLCLPHHACYPFWRGCLWDLHNWLSLVAHSNYISSEKAYLPGLLIAAFLYPLPHITQTRSSPTGNSNLDSPLSEDRAQSHPSYLGQCTAAKRSHKERSRVAECLSVICSLWGLKVALNSAETIALWVHLKGPNLIEMESAAFLL